MASFQARPYDFDKDGNIDLSDYVVRQDSVELTKLEVETLSEWLDLWNLLSQEVLRILLESVVCATCKKIFCKPNAVRRHILAVHKDPAPLTWNKNDEVDVAQIGIQRIREVLC